MPARPLRVLLLRPVLLVVLKTLLPRLRHPRVPSEASCGARGGNLPQSANTRPDLFMTNLNSAYYLATPQGDSIRMWRSSPLGTLPSADPVAFGPVPPPPVIATAGRRRSTASVTAPRCPPPGPSPVTRSRSTRSAAAPEVREAPVFLYGNGRIWITYFACDTGKPHYQPWLVSMPLTSDPLVPGNSQQHQGPVFSRADDRGDYERGHHAFFRSPDDTEDRIPYHAKTTSAYTYSDRTTRAQKFTCCADGFPDFGRRSRSVPRRTCPPAPRGLAPTGSTMTAASAARRRHLPRLIELRHRLRYPVLLGRRPLE